MIVLNIRKQLIDFPMTTFVFLHFSHELNFLVICLINIPSLSQRVYTSFSYTLLKLFYFLKNTSHSYRQTSKESNHFYKYHYSFLRLILLRMSKKVTEGILRLFQRIAAVFFLNITYLPLLSTVLRAKCGPGSYAE